MIGTFKLFKGSATRAVPKYHIRACLGLHPHLNGFNRTYSDKSKYNNIDEYNKNKTEYNFNQKFEHLDVNPSPAPKRTDQLHSQINQRYQDEELLNINELLENDPRLSQFEYGSPDYKDMLHKINEEFKRDQSKRNKKIENRERWKAFAFGVCAIIGIVSCHQFIMHYDWYMSLLNKSSYNIDEDDTKTKNKNVKQLDFFRSKLAAMLDNEFVNGLLDSQTNSGLYIFGNQNHRRLPARVEFFNNMILKQVQILDDYLVVVTDDGKLYHFAESMKKPELLKLPSKAEKCQVFKDKIYVLTKSGDVGYICRESTGEIVSTTNWLGLRRHSNKYETLSFKDDNDSGLLNRGERIADFSGGDNHLLMLTNRGRLFNVKVSEGDNRGQYGLPQYSPVKDSTIPTNKVFEMALLNNELITGDNNTKSLVPRRFTRISAGKFHNIVSDSYNNIWAWGDNGSGQCGISVTYKNGVQSVPQKVLMAKDLTRLIGGGDDLQIEQLLCNEETSLIKTNKGLITFGNGLKGQLGNNRFLHVCNNATHVKSIADMMEFNETTNKTQPIKIKDISSGSNHTCIKLDNAGDGKDILVFGDNEFGQLGNGKVVKSAKPVNMPKLIEPEDLKDIKSEKSKVMNKLTKKINDPYSRLNLNEKLTINGVKVKQMIEATDNSTVIYYTRG